MISANDVQRQVQMLLGRPATADEITYYNKFIQDEGLTPYEVGQAIQSLPEYQGKQLETQGQKYSQALGANDQGILGQAAAMGQSRFAGLGRPQSSAQGAQFAQAAQNLAQSRQSALAAFYGQGLQNVANQSLAQGQGALERGYGLRDEKRQRGYQMEDYTRQSNAYQDYLNAQKRSRNQGLALQAGTMALGAGLGAAFAPGITPGVGGAAATGFGRGQGALYGMQAGGMFGRNY